MEPQPVSIAGQILSLYDRGFSQGEIAKELRLPIGRVRATIKQAQSRSLDSRRLFEVSEMLIEALALLRELVSEHRQREAAKRWRTIQRDLPQMLGRAIEATTPATTDKPL
jgi:hypothetical protein